ncbi:MAG: NADH-quinone oxidoreductase subunit C [Thermoplasmata archaeon]|nr:NADH-quinone oxidoreductase subunit C [Thermoplasmata archaeon]MCI4338316.1 NADH-quinone oxidoreductase subunit C [Thermoplasmata archaeon]MCI4341194.1 NADH-quinone oxidoreductase subunit C [Thermoplasmata archaeon]
MEAEEVGARLRERFPDVVVEPFPGTAGRIRFPAARLIELLTEVRDGLGFDHLGQVGAIDWVEERELFYTVWSDRAKQYLFLSTRIPAGEPHLESLTPVFPSANWHEREACELVGITFDHHPDLRPLLTPTGYQFHPLLRSFRLHEPEELEVKVRDV